VKELKEILYYSVRFPTALLGLMLLVAPFVPNSEAAGDPTLGEGLYRSAILVMGVFILWPNHKFLTTSRRYYFRLISLSIVGAVSIWAGAAMMIEYYSSGKTFDPAMAGIGGFFLVCGLCLPPSVYLRRKNPTA
jgi:hypothetical protein